MKHIMFTSGLPCPHCFCEGQMTPRMVLKTPTATPSLKRNAEADSYNIKVACLYAHELSLD